MSVEGQGNKCWNLRLLVQCKWRRSSLNPNGGPRKHQKSWRFELSDLP